MDQNLSNALTRAAGILAAVLVLFGVNQAVQTFYMVNPQAKAPEQATFDVSGTGKVDVVPDTATLTVSVVDYALAKDDVTSAGNATMTAVINAIKALGVKSEDLQTSEYQLNPHYDYSSDTKEPDQKGYDFTQSLTVTVSDVDQTSAIIEAATAAGANSVSSPSFTVEDPDAAKAEARAKAFANAKEKAEQLAKAAGVTLGDIVSFTESSDDGIVPYYAERSAVAADAGSAPTIEKGSNEISVTVNVTYAIKN